MEKIRSADGTELAYDVRGSGPPLVYITGATCFRRFWPIRQDAKVFGRAFTVHTYDRRGRGDSGDTLPWSVEREVEDVAAVIEAAGGSAYVYGHSSGAVLALEAALRLPQMVRGAVLYDAPYVHDEAEQAEYAQLSRAVQGLLDDHRHAAAVKAFLRGIGMPRAFTVALPLVPGWRTMRDLAPTLAYDIALTRDPPPLARAARAAVPVLVAVGEKSPPGLHAVADRLAAAIPGAEHRVVAGQDHLVKATEMLDLLVQLSA